MTKDCNQWLQEALRGTNTKLIERSNGPIADGIASIKSLDFLWKWRWIGTLFLSRSHSTLSDFLQKIQLNQNNLLSARQATETLRHELIHAFDLERPGFSQENCLHIACTEIRAAKLSGDCSLLNEIMRGQIHSPLGFYHRLEHCVRRRSTLALDMLPHCQSSSKDSVESVWTRCFQDSSPFDDL